MPDTSAPGASRRPGAARPSRNPAARPSPRGAPAAWAAALGLALACPALLAGADAAAPSAAAPAPAAPAAAPTAADLAARLLAESGTRGGLVVHLGCGDGRLTAALHAGNAFLVHGLDRSADQVAAARRHVEDRGLYGPVSVDRLAGPALPYADNLVNLLVADAADAPPMDEVMRVLAPGGAACLRADGRWTRTVKPWPADIDSWPHFLHGADGNPVANDRRVGPPRGLQWVCGPRWSKHHEKFPPTVPVLVSAGGRVFAIEDETPPCAFGVQAKWFLAARDAFNGTLLWRLPLPGWQPETWPGTLGGWAGGPADYRRRLVATADRVFVTPGHAAPLTALDAATGQTVRTFPPAGEHVEVLHEGGRLYVAWRADRRSPCRVTVLEADAGSTAWDRPGGHGIAVQGGRIFYLTDDGRVGALDAADGRSLWTSSPLEGLDAAHSNKGRFQLRGPLRAGAGVVLACPGNGGSVVALASDTGRVLWVRASEGRAAWWIPVSAHIIDNLVWMTGRDEGAGHAPGRTFALGLDPATGALARAVPCDAVWNCGHHQRCYPSKATVRYLLYSRRGAEFLDLATGDVTLSNWTRGACTYGVMPCNGLLYAPPHACRCYSETALRGLHALAPGDRSPRGPAGPPLAGRAAAGDTATAEASGRAPAPAGAGAGSSAEADAPAAADGRLERGPAFGRPAWRGDAAGETDDWPTYRHDTMRSGATRAAVPADLRPAWQAAPGGRLTAPTVAGGRVFTALADAHRVLALEADTGRTLWSFTAGGRLDTPPALAGDLAFFGCADGRVYAVGAADGQLAWRFRAAPEDRRVGCDGQLESAWPVWGGVLVRDGTVYAVAGRSSFLDGGLWLYGLEAGTGRVRFAHRRDGPHTDAGQTPERPSPGFVLPGALPDVLAADEGRIYMRHMAFDPALRTAIDMQPNFYPAERRAGEEAGGDHKYWCDLAEAPRQALRIDPAWFFRSYFHNFPGRRLYSTTGLLDDSWHIRSYWSYGQVVGQYLVFEGDRGYAVQAYPNAARWLAHTAGQGYVLYAGRTAEPRPGERLYALRPEERAWSVTLPMRPRAMVLAAGVLLVAGTPDPADPAEALAALEGKRGARLWAVSAADGRLLAEHALDAPPTFDGLAAAGGRLYLTTTDGRVVCLGGGAAASSPP